MGCIVDNIAHIIWCSLTEILGEVCSNPIIVSVWVTLGICDFFAIIHIIDLTLGINPECVTKLTLIELRPLTEHGHGGTDLSLLGNLTSLEVGLPRSLIGDQFGYIIV